MKKLRDNFYLNDNKRENWKKILKLVKKVKNYKIKAKKAFEFQNQTSIIWFISIFYKLDFSKNTLENMSHPHNFFYPSSFRSLIVISHQDYTNHGFFELERLVFYFWEILILFQLIIILLVTNFPGKDSHSTLSIS